MARAKGVILALVTPEIPGETAELLDGAEPIDRPVTSLCG